MNYIALAFALYFLWRAFHAAFFRDRFIEKTSAELDELFGKGAGSGPDALEEIEAHRMFSIALWSVVSLFLALIV